MDPSRSIWAAEQRGARVEPGRIVRNEWYDTVSNVPDCNDTDRYVILKSTLRLICIGVSAHHSAQVAVCVFSYLLLPKALPPNVDS